MAGQLRNSLTNIQNIISEELDRNSELKSPTLIAVSKKQTSEKIRELFSLGVIDFGENYLQEFSAKKEELADLNIRWHFIGNIQSKKISNLVGEFDLIHSVSRGVELEKISRFATEFGVTQKVLLQVNIANEETKQGFSIGELKALVPNSWASVQVCGLMVFPPLETEEEKSLAWYKKSKNLFEGLKVNWGESFCRLSMGTSSDFHLALREGATELRIGERLMGPRT